MLSGIRDKSKPKYVQPLPAETSFSELTDEEVEAIEATQVEKINDPMKDHPVPKTKAEEIFADGGKAMLEQDPDVSDEAVLAPKVPEHWHYFLSDDYMLDAYERTMEAITDKQGNNHKNAITERVMEQNTQAGGEVFDVLDWAVWKGILFMPRTNYYMKAEKPKGDLRDLIGLVQKLEKEEEKSEPPMEAPARSDPMFLLEKEEEEKKPEPLIMDDPGTPIPPEVFEKVIEPIDPKEDLDVASDLMNDNADIITEDNPNYIDISACTCGKCYFTDTKKWMLCLETRILNFNRNIKPLTNWAGEMDREKGVFALSKEYMEEEVSADMLAQFSMKAYAHVRETLSGKSPKNVMKWENMAEDSEAKLIIRAVCTMILDNFKVTNNV